MQERTKFGESSFKNLIDALTKYLPVDALVHSRYDPKTNAFRDHPDVIVGPKNLDLRQYIDLSDVVKERHKAQIVHLPTIGNAFLISVLAYDVDSHTPSAVMSMVVPIDAVIGMLFKMQSHYSETVSIVDKRGVVAGSSEKRLVGKSVGKKSGVDIELRPLKNYSGGWQYKLGGLEQYSVITKMPSVGGTLLVSVSEEYLLGKWQEYLQQLLVLLGIIIVVGCLLAVWIAHRLSKPMRHLAEVMAHVGEGSLGERYSSDRLGFEINHIGSKFNQMVDSMILHMKSAEDERVKQEVFAAELAIGKQTQRAIMPRRIPEFGGLEIEQGFVAAKEVGGDFYDVYVRDENTLWVCIADTAGKGVSACLYSLLIRSMLRSFIDVSSHLNEVIKKANALFMKDCGDSGIFVTAWVGLYDKRTGELTYSSLGHNPSLIRRANGELESLTTEGMALGVASFEPTIAKTTLNSDDLLLLYTDGVVEAHNKQNELYGVDRLMSFLKSVDRSSGVVDGVLDDVRNFCEGALQFDDITLVSIQKLS